MARIAITGVLFLFGLFSVCSADLIPPGKRPKPQPADSQKPPGEREMIIRIDPQAKEARLIVPAQPSNRLEAALPPESTSPARTMAAGVAMSAGIASLFLLRRRKAVAVTGSAATGLLILLIGSSVNANVPPPERIPEVKASADWLTAATILNEFGGENGRVATGKIKIEYSERANVVTLVIPKSMAKRPGAAPPAAPKSAPQENKPDAK